MSIVKQLIENATAGLLPAVADKVAKAVVVAYWRGVEDGQASPIQIDGQVGEALTRAGLDHYMPRDAWKCRRCGFGPNHASQCERCDADRHR